MEIAIDLGAVALAGDQPVNSESSVRVGLGAGVYACWGVGVEQGNLARLVAHEARGELQRGGVLGGIYQHDGGVVVLIGPAVERREGVLRAVGGDPLLGGPLGSARREEGLGIDVGGAIAR